MYSVTLLAALCLSKSHYMHLPCSTPATGSCALLWVRLYVAFSLDPLSSLNRCYNLWHIPSLFTVRNPLPVDFMSVSKIKVIEVPRVCQGERQGGETTITVYCRTGLQTVFFFYHKSYLWRRGVDGCLFWMVETSGKKAMTIPNVIQILLTFLVACLPVFFLKTATMKNRNRPFLTGRKQREERFEMLTTHVNLITTWILTAQWHNTIRKSLQKQANKITK